MRPRRSALYVPGSNARALAKAASLDADVLIFDLEDAVLPEAKIEARAAIAAVVGTGWQEKIVRVNGLDTPWGAADLAWAATLPIDGVLLPKVDDPTPVRQAERAVPCAIWCMVETPRGVIGLDAIARDSDRLAVLVMGTSDLVKSLRARHVADRAPVAYALGRAVMVARAYGLDVLDGVHLAIDDDAGFRASSEASRGLGFDGRTLIHPRTIAEANRVYGASAEEVAHAERVIAAFAVAEQRGQGVAVLDGALIERLHVEEAERIIATHRATTR